MRIPTRIFPMIRNLKRISRAGAFILSAVCLSSCTPNQRIVESNGHWSNAESNRVASTRVQRTLEQDIESMRTADFIFIYVIKRKDGGSLEAEDRQFASSVIPGEMNRRTISGDGKAILVGSNFRMPEAERKLLEERFSFEDLSRDSEGRDVNANSSQPSR